MSKDVELIEAAREGDAEAFEVIAARHRRELAAHCYPMLGSPVDAEDAVQEALLAAWRGLPSFEGRNSQRSWLYRITTNVCLRLGSSRSARLLAFDVCPPLRSAGDLGEVIPGPVWMEPWPQDVVADEPGPDARYLRRGRTWQPQPDRRHEQ